MTATPPGSDDGHAAPGDQPLGHICFLRVERGRRILVTAAVSSVRRQDAVDDIAKLPGILRALHVKPLALLDELPPQDRRGRRRFLVRDAARTANVPLAFVPRPIARHGDLVPVNLVASARARYVQLGHGIRRLAGTFPFDGPIGRVGAVWQASAPSLCERDSALEERFFSHLSQVERRHRGDRQVSWLLTVALLIVPFAGVGWHAVRLATETTHILVAVGTLVLIGVGSFVAAPLALQVARPMTRTGLTGGPGSRRESAFLVVVWIVAVGLVASVGVALLQRFSLNPLDHLPGNHGLRIPTLNEKGTIDFTGIGGSPRTGPHIWAGSLFLLGSVLAATTVVVHVLEWQVRRWLWQVRSRSDLATGVLQPLVEAYHALSERGPRDDGTALRHACILLERAANNVLYALPRTVDAPRLHTTTARSAAVVGAGLRALSERAALARDTTRTELQQPIAAVVRALVLQRYGTLVMHLEPLSRGRTVDAAARPPRWRPTRSAVVRAGLVLVGAVLMSRWSWLEKQPFASTVTAVLTAAVALVGGPGASTSPSAKGDKVKDEPPDGSPTEQIKELLAVSRHR